MHPHEHFQLRFPLPCLPAGDGMDSSHIDQNHGDLVRTAVGERARCHPAQTTARIKASKSLDKTPGSTSGQHSGIAMSSIDL